MIMAFLGQVTQEHALVVGLVILAVSLGMLVLTRRRIARRQQGLPSETPGRTASHSLLTGRPQSREVQENMREMMLELEQLSREINSQVDTRLRALNLLVQEADQKIRELKRLQGTPPREGAQGDSLVTPAGASPQAALVSERYAKVYALADRGRSVVDIARELGMMTGEVELILALRRSAPDAREARP